MSEETSSGNSGLFPFLARACAARRPQFLDLAPFTSVNDRSQSRLVTGVLRLTPPRRRDLPSGSTPGRKFASRTNMTTAGAGEAADQ